MALAKLKNPFESIQGALTPKGIVHRRKIYRNAKGKIVAKGKQEAYSIENPRDYAANPPKGAELANINRWREASHRAAQLMMMERLDADIPEQQRKAYECNHIPIYYTWQQAKPIIKDFHARFDAQFKPGATKCYVQFPAFLRAMIYKDLKTSGS